MIPLSNQSNVDLNANEKPSKYKAKLEDYYKLLMSNTRKSSRDKLDAWCSANIKIDKETSGNEWKFKDVVCASPENIIRIKQLIDHLEKKEKDTLTQVSKYVVTCLYSNHLRGNAREILERAAAVHVCPYCNRNLTKQIEIKGKFTTTCELDHFFSERRGKRN